MREIKFRGLRTDSKGWVYGYLTIDNLGKCIIRWFNGDAHNIPFACEVIPESVGQFTGLKDANGNDIYEGDNLVSTKGRYCRGVVKFDEATFYFKIPNSLVRLKTRNISNRGLQITGNIHENN